MSTSDKNLSTFLSPIPDGSGLKIGIVWAEWNHQITGAMRDDAIKLLLESGVSEQDILIRKVPGTFELALAAQKLGKTDFMDGIICIGCVIKGETPHFDFICQATANGIMNVGLNLDKPVIFGVLTTNNLEQAIERAGGKHGNKGGEAAYSLLMMLR